MICAEGKGCKLAGHLLPDTSGASQPPLWLYCISLEKISAAILMRHSTYRNQLIKHLIIGTMAICNSLHPLLLLSEVAQLHASCQQDHLLQGWACTLASQALPLHCSMFEDMSWCYLPQRQSLAEPLPCVVISCCSICFPLFLHIVHGFLGSLSTSAALEFRLPGCSLQHLVHVSV